MSKEIKHGSEAQEFVINGIDKVANIVKTTVGPSGRNVLVRNQISQPIITNDGVTIAKSIELKDNTEDAAARVIIQAANKTNDIAGDGTTTTTILAQEMIHKYFELKENSTDFVNVVKVQKDMIKTANEISDYLKTKAVEVKDNEDIKKVATISSGDPQTGELIASAFKQAGDFGSVVVEDSKTGLDSIEPVEGMKISNGMINPYLFVDRPNSISNLKDPQILVTTEKLDSASDVLPILNDCAKSGRKLVIICEDMGVEVLNTIINNKIRGVPLNVSAIRLPGFGELRESLIEDICISTGATLLSRERGLTLKDYSENILGIADEITITNDDTVIKFTNTKTESNDLLNKRKERVEELQIKLDKAEENDKEQYTKRIANLTTGITTIKVGGNSEIELNDRKLRIEDAINSVTSAKEEGIVPGGGYSFLDYYANVVKNEEEPISLGRKVVYESIKSVTRQIAENAGYDGKDVVDNCIKQEKGFNALTGEYENLLETGVINSVKVDRYSLLNATSVAATAITLGGSVVEENEKDQNILQLQGPLPAMM